MRIVIDKSSQVQYLLKSERNKIGQRVWLGCSCSNGLSWSYAKLWSVISFPHCPELRWSGRTIVSSIQPVGCDICWGLVWKRKWAELHFQHSQQLVNKDLVWGGVLGSVGYTTAFITRTTFVPRTLLCTRVVSRQNRHRHRYLPLYTFHFHEYTLL